MINFVLFFGAAIMVAFIWAMEEFFTAYRIRMLARYISLGDPGLYSQRWEEEGWEDRFFAYQTRLSKISGAISFVMIEPIVWGYFFGGMGLYIYHHLRI
jgi:hypothetical protein